MKSVNFLRYLREHNCYPYREGGNHTIVMNELNKKISSIPRHKEIKNNLVKKICKDLEVPAPSSFQ